MFGQEELWRYREGNRLEFKEAQGGLPRSFWETYSSFANTQGGLIVLGAAEKSDGTMRAIGIANLEALRRDLWGSLNNEQKVSTNLLLDSDITQESIDGKSLLLVYVPRADRTLRPVYINDNPKRGSFRRNGDGDYHCTAEELRAMARDSAEGATDKLVLPAIDLGALSAETIGAYRNVFAGYRPDHPWTHLGNEEFLLRLGAVGRSAEDGMVHPTRAGLLMFGEAWRITDEYPNYFLDCRRQESRRRWDDRISSDDGEWSGNVYDFYRRASPMLARELPVPFELDAAMHRVSDTPQHKALREGLVNALVHADYYGRTGVVVIRHPGNVTFSNPGGLRLAADVIEGGGVSDPRNPTLFKMFNLIGLGEKAGSGFDVLRYAARYASVADPLLEELGEPDRVRLTVHVRLTGDVGNDGDDVGDVGSHVGNVGDDVGGDVGDVGGPARRPSDTEAVVLAEIRANPKASAKDIAAKIQRSDRQVERAQRSLREAKVIERVGGTRGHWKVNPNSGGNL